MKHLTVGRAIVRKELIEASRTTRGTFLLAVVLSLGVQFAAMRAASVAAQNGRLPTLAGLGGVESAATFTLLFVGPIFMPMFANTLFARSLMREKLLGSLMPVLATGVQPGFLWGAKVVAAFLASYVVALVCITSNILLTRLYFHAPVRWSGPLFMTVFVLAPLASFSIIAVTAFLYWTVRSAFLITIANVIVPLWLYRYAVQPSTRPLFILSLVYVSAMLCLFCLVLLGLAVNRLSRKYILGL